jgi:hypothetical protein
MHDVRVSIIVKFFSAAGDDSAGDILDAGLKDTPGVLEVGNFDAVSTIEDWDGILTGRDLDEIGRDDRPRVIAEEPFLTAFSPLFQRALTTADRSDLARVVVRWIEQEELGGYDPELFTEILSELAAMARTADQHGHTLYCWMC